MDLSTAVTATVSTLRRRPADLLPFYFLGTAVPVIARTALLLALAGAYLHAELTGGIDAVRDALAGADLTPPNLEDPEAVERWAEGLAPVFEPLVSPTTVALVVGGMVAAVLISVLAYAAVSAGQMSAVIARLRGNRGLTAGIAGVRDRWLTFLGLYVAELLLWLGVVLLASVAVGVAALVGGPLVGAVVGLGALLVGGAALVLVRIVFAFAPAAIVVDDAGVFGAVEGAGGFVRSNPVDAIAYLVVAVGVLVAISSAASALAFLGGGAVVALASAVVAAPALDLLKTVLYGDHRGAVDPVDPPEASVRTQFTGGVRRGMAETRVFVRRTPGTHLLVVAVGVAGGVAGWMLAGPFVGVVPTSIEARLGGLPPAAALEFFGNNWTVTIATAFGGIALVLPALSSIAFNGLALGAVAALEGNLPALVAFVIPHGLLEIPAIVVSGALGVRLGVVAWRAFRGRLSRVGFADAVENAFWVTVGVGVLLAVAALIEGFVSPYYWRPFL
ncbi:MULTISPECIES: stage II sporulation protein M [Haloferacaceae]|uniref:Stage II sporulation protein M n=1 Tax=Halorubrum glutamatedens TaxID=2707018 RepID=A0ABD5QPM0_9EURY|nr:stage II sporulation protein M [Halobellus captivus]